MRLSKVFLLSIILTMTFTAWVKASAQSIGSFQVTRLIGSAGSGAPLVDPRMVNAWGNAFFQGGPFWINDNNTGVSELIDGQGNIDPALPFVMIPGASGGQGQPSGIVANSTADFVLPGFPGGPALFIFATEDGTISAWNYGTAATIQVNNSGKAAYEGLALAKNGTANQLYAANQGVPGHPGSIDVFDGSFHSIAPSGGFIDPSLPANFAPYNVTNIKGNLFVAYSQGLQAVGQVDEFDPNGKLIMTFTSNTLASPWGMAVAPSSFGTLAGDLLVGNLVDGTISAFDLTDGAFVGQLADSNSKKISIPGLWSLVDGTGALNAQAGAIYFTAGPNNYSSGVFGLIKAVGGTHPAFFKGEASLGSGFFFLVFADGNRFGFYTYDFFPFLFHVDLGFDYFVDANNAANGAYLFDFKLGDWFYTDPTVFPFMFNFAANAWYYYFPDAKNPNHYTTNPRVFENLTTMQAIFS